MSPECDRHDWRTRVFDQIKGLVAVECRVCGVVEDADGVLVELMHIRDDWLEEHPVDDEHRIRVVIGGNVFRRLKTSAMVANMSGGNGGLLETLGGRIVDAIERGADSITLNGDRKGNR